MAEEKKTKTATKTATTAKKTPAKKAPATKKAEAPKEEVATPKKAVSKPKKAPAKAAAHNRLLDKYNTQVKPLMMDKYRYTSIMQVPHLEKIVINVGVGDALTNHKVLEDVVNEISVIAGQHPVITKAKKSVASFKLREGQSIGVKVTLRGIRMYEFLDKLMSIALPRVRDFRGVSRNAFDGHGNYTLGIKEQLIFPEIDYDKVNKFRGMDVVIVTTALTDDEAFSLLEALGMPFHR